MAKTIATFMVLLLIALLISLFFFVFFVFLVKMVMVMAMTMMAIFFPPSEYFSYSSPCHHLPTRPCSIFPLQVPICF